VEGLAEKSTMTAEDRRSPSAIRSSPKTTEDAAGDPTEPLATAIFFPCELPGRAIQAARFVQIQQLLSVIRPKGYRPITGHHVAQNFLAFSDFSINQAELKQNLENSYLEFRNSEFCK
jgi:hypothetical protein